MASPISTRLASLENKLGPVPGKVKRVISLVTNQGDEDAARALLLSEGYDPYGDDICIIRLIAPVPNTTLQPRVVFDQDLADNLVETVLFDAMAARKMCAPEMDVDAAIRLAAQRVWSHIQ